MAYALLHKIDAEKYFYVNAAIPEILHPEFTANGGYFSIQQMHYRLEGNMITHRQKSFLVLSALVSCIVIFGSLAQADVIYSSFGPGDPADLSEGWVIGAFSMRTAGIPDVLTKIAAPFTPGADYTLNSIDLALWNLASAYPLLDVNLLSGSSAPDTLIASEQISVPRTSDSGVFTASFLSGISLTSGTQYWVMLAPTDMANSEMLWEFNSTFAAGVVSASLDGGPWTAVSNSSEAGAAFINGGSINPFYEGTPYTPSFTVYGTPKTTSVPEPSTLLLLGSGVVGLWGFRKKFISGA